MASSKRRLFLEDAAEAGRPQEERLAGFAALSPPYGFGK